MTYDDFKLKHTKKIYKTDHSSKNKSELHMNRLYRKKKRGHEKSITPQIQISYKQNSFVSRNIHIYSTPDNSISKKNQDILD